MSYNLSPIVLCIESTLALSLATVAITLRIFEKSQRLIAHKQCHLGHMGTVCDTKPSYKLYRQC